MHWCAPSRIGLHMPLVLGDYVEELKAVADIFGYETVVCL